MRSKAPLALIEQTVMLLVFALAAVFCLRLFAWADSASAKSTARDRAMVQAQNAAEVLKHCRGNFAEVADILGGSPESSGWSVCYDEEWTQTDGPGEYLLRAEAVEDELPYLGRAQVRVTRDGTELASLNVAWQEVAP